MKFSLILCTLSYSVSRKGRRREPKSTELTSYVSGALPMLLHLTSVRKGFWIQRTEPEFLLPEGIQKRRTFEKSSAVAPARPIMFLVYMLIANDILTEPTSKTGFESC